MKTIEETFAEYLKEFKTNIVKAVLGMFEQDKGVQPVVFGLVIHENKPALAVLQGLAELFDSDEGKEQAARIIREASTTIKPLALCFVSEGWISEKAFSDYESVVDKDGNYREGVVRPADDPNRKEIIMMLFETHDKEAFVHFEMIRDGEEVTLQERLNVDWEPKKGNVKGRFMNLLGENYAELAQSIKTNLANSQN